MEVRVGIIGLFGPDGPLRGPFPFIAICLALDIVLGDPQYRLHPIRVMGKALASAESRLRWFGLDGRFGGFLLFLSLAAGFDGAGWAVSFALRKAGEAAGAPAYGWAMDWIWRAYLGYSLLALGDLIRHGKRIAVATRRGDLAASRAATAMLVGRDVDSMDFAACNRAAVESLAESLCDGVIAPLFWFALLGLPGLILFKVASTMDSMVGYKDERYLRFGWFGARLDDVMNWIPARLCLGLIALFACLVPGYSGRKAWTVAIGQHALLPGPNKGWSETAAAGALDIRLAGPIRKHGILVNEIWIGPGDAPEGGAPRDVTRMITLAYGATALFMGLAWICLRSGRPG
ncbi:MAG: cobD [Fibrobacteres bacterium]|nr:cobD [Fibrobacterota bacterium]